MTTPKIHELTPTSRVGATPYPVADWISEIKENGYAIIPFYHNTKERDAEYKSKSARGHLVKQLGVIYFSHANDAEGNRWLVVSGNKAVLEKEGLKATKEEIGDY